MKIKKRKLLENFVESNKGGFWKLVNKTTRKKTFYNYHSIDGKNEGDEIVKIFDSIRKRSTSAKIFIIYSRAFGLILNPSSVDSIAKPISKLQIYYFLLYMYIWLNRR